MLLDKLFECVSEISKDTEDVDDILKRKELDEFRSRELLDKTDQEILEFLKMKEDNKDKREFLFSIFQKLKIEQSIDILSDSLEDEKKNEIENILKNLFGKILEPNSIEITDEKVLIQYEFDDRSRLKNIVSDIERWNKDNVIESVSKKFGVPIENIIFVDSVSTYIEFISEFEENDYVSRGQKDCSYELAPSLYRLYENEYAGHSSEYEDSFRQKI